MGRLARRDKFQLGRIGPVTRRFALLFSEQMHNSFFYQIIIHKYTLTQNSKLKIQNLD